MPRKSRLDKPLEWYPWSPLQWQSSRRVQRLTWAQKGLYRELLDECYLKGSLPADPEGIADLLGEDLSNIGHDLVPVLRCFVATEDGRLTNPTIERVRAEQMEVRLARITRRKGRESDPEDPENGENGTTNVVHGATGTTNVVSVTTGTTRTGQDRTGHIKETTTPLPPQAGEPKPRRKRKALGLTEEAACWFDLAWETFPTEYRTHEGKTRNLRLDQVKVEKLWSAILGGAMSDLLGGTPATAEELACAAQLYIAGPHPNVERGFASAVGVFYSISENVDSKNLWVEAVRKVREFRKAGKADIARPFDGSPPLRRPQPPEITMTPITESIQ